MELLAVRAQAWLLAEGENPVGYLVDPRRGVTWRIAIATALAGGYWEAPATQPSQAEIKAALARFPVRDHPSVETLRRAELPAPLERE